MQNSKKVIGILGGGQLARMLAVAAARLGHQTHIYDPNSESPAFEVCRSNTIAPFSDQSSLVKFAKTLDVLTFEFENIPSKSLDILLEFVPIFPPVRALTISQDRLAEKTFLRSLGLRTVKWQPVSSNINYKESIAKIGMPAILKTCRNGYDGKGQILITKTTSEEQISKFLRQGRCILEEFCQFNKEISVIVARSQNGEVMCFDPGENVHVNGILKSTTVPAKVSKAISFDAAVMAGKIVTALDYVGVMGVEFFLDSSNQLLTNEIAPRVHNSGHWTQNGCSIDQFEQHIRAITGCEIGNGDRHANVKMVNLLGNEVEKALEIANASVHLYGKKKIAPGRKMGHVNYISRKTS